ncbi:MAG: cytochrome b/b6 domain-containing protein [Betaproteobacteria bacterium]
MAYAASAGTHQGASTILYYRHRLPVRIMHWTNVICLTVLFMSGLNIFNAHPALNWGKSSYTGVAPFFEIGAKMADGKIIGVTRIAGHEFDTTNRLGAFYNEAGEANPRAFPSWLTVPGTQWLSMARRWHFFFAWLFVINGAAYVAWSVFSRHLARDLAPTRRDWRTIGQSIRDHLRFRHPTGEAARQYNVLQKLAYLAVIFILLPVLILMGLAMSPWVNGIFTGWIDIVGGRQSARTLHFIAAWLLVGFVLIHVFEVIVSGLWNHVRSMITGRYRITVEANHDVRR